MKAITGIACSTVKEIQAQDTSPLTAPSPPTQILPPKWPSDLPTSLQVPSSRRHLPPLDSLQPTTFSQSISDAAEMQTWPHGCLPDTFRKQGLQGLPHAP